MKLKILFRTSGGRAPKKELGFGHIYRSINLAKNLKSHKLFFLLEDFGGAEKVFKKNGFHDIYKIKKRNNIFEDIKNTKKIIEQKKIDLLILDIFKPKLRFIREIRKLTKIVIISDLNRKEYPADLVVNGFIGFNNKIVKNEFGSKCLLGPMYQIISQKSKKKILGKNPNYDILATFGGYDEKNIVDLLLLQLIKFKGKIKTKIILGPGSNKTKKTKFLEKKLKKSVSIITHSDNMNKEISNARIGLCSGGITSYEFASLKKPFGIICQTAHQLKTAKEWEKKKIAINLGLKDKTTNNKLEKFLSSITENKFKKLSKNSYVDGLGAKRVAKEILDLA